MKLVVPYYPQGSDTFGCIKAAVMMVLTYKGVETIPVSPGPKGLSEQDEMAYASMYSFGVVEKPPRVARRTDLFRVFLVEALAKYGPVIAEISLPRGGLGHPMASYAHLENNEFHVGAAWSHAVVINGYDDRNVYYLDPAKGHVEQSRDWNDIIEEIAGLWIHNVTEGDLQRYNN